jgi:hypothetical protein
LSSKPYHQQHKFCNWKLIRIHLVVKEVAEKYKQFVKYYDSRLKPRISSFVTEANKRMNTKKLWANNNAVSLAAPFFVSYKAGRDPTPCW